MDATVRRVAAILIGAVLALSAGSLRAEEAAPPAAEKAKAVFPLAGLEPLYPSRYSLEELEAMWPAFKHEPFDSSGTNPIVLPFLWQSKGKEDDPAEAYAFSFVLSQRIEWAPSNYSSSHAYFVFKRSRELMTGLSQVYDNRNIAQAMKAWSATHAFGGVLRKGRAGMSGELRGFDRTGKLAFTKNYARPREFFELVGDMSEDALTFLGAKPSPALAKHLRHKSCDHPESLIELGKAAFVPEKTREEFGWYDSILERDPGFAEVRYWYANQKKWSDGDAKHFYRQAAQSLGSYLTASALWDFDPEDCPDKSLAKEYPQWIQQAEELVGPEFPTLVKNKLIEFREFRQAPPAYVENATRLAGRWPNNYWFLHDLARVYNWGDGLLCDADMAASIEVAALRNRCVPGIGHKNNALYELAKAMSDLGHHDITAQILTPLCSPDQSATRLHEHSVDASVLGKSLVSCGRYADAVPLFLAAYKGDINEVFRRESLVHAGVAAALAGQPEVLDGILRDHGPLLTEGGLRPVLEGYREAVSGKPVDGPALMKQMQQMSWCGGMEAMILCAQLDLLNKKSDSRGVLAQWLSNAPGDRRLWFLMDAYDRQENRPESAEFYGMIEWLHGKDPWVVKAVASWRERSQGRPTPKVMTADELGRKLEGFQLARWPKADLSAANRARDILNSLPPGTVDGVIRRLIAERQFDKAEELTRRFHSLAVTYENLYVRCHANHLVHLVEQARPAEAAATGEH